MSGGTISDLDITPILEYYGVFNPPEGPGWRTVKCPFHTDKNASARSNGKGFICNGCGVKGNAISLIMERENIDFSSAIEFYEKESGRSVPDLRKGKSRKRRRPLSDEPVDYERSGGLFSSGIRPRKRPFSGA